MQKTTYNDMRKELALIVQDWRILAGETVAPPPDTTWQDVAGTLAVNLRTLAAMLDNWRRGNAEPFLVFPSLDDAGIVQSERD